MKALDWRVFRSYLSLETAATEKRKVEITSSGVLRNSTAYTGSLSLRRIIKEQV